MIPKPILDHWLSLLAPLPRETVEQWARRKLRLSSRVSAVEGPLRFDARPYAREPLECYRDRKIKLMALCFGSQLAKTTIMQAGALYRADVMPGPALWCLPSGELAQSIVKTRFFPLVEDSPGLSHLYPIDRRGKITLAEQQWTTCNMVWIGGNSPSQASSRPIKYLYVDESDKLPDGSSKEAGTWELVRQRTKTFPDSFTVVSSTPSVEDGIIWRVLSESDFRRYYLPCPHCSEMQILEQPQLRWDQSARLSDGRWDLRRVAETTFHECPKCGGPMTDSDKIRVLGRGVWRATNDGAMPGHVGFHLPSFYSPDPSCYFGILAAQFLAAQQNGSRGLLQDYVNQVLAEPWMEQLAAKGGAADLIIGSFGAETPWEDSEITIGGCDVQTDCLWAVFLQISRLHGVRVCWEGRLDNWDGLDAVAARVGCNSAHIGVDTGDGTATQAIYAECLRRGYRAMRGEDREHYFEKQLDGKMSRVIYRESESKIATGQRVPLLLWASQGGQDLVAWLITGAGPSFLFPQDVSADMVTHCKSHVKKAKGGRSKWVRRGKMADHLWDALCMAVVMACYGGVLERPTEKLPD